MLETGAVRYLQDDRFVQLETRRAALNYRTQLRDTCGAKFILKYFDTLTSCLKEWLQASSAGGLHFSLQKIPVDNLYKLPLKLPYHVAKSICFY